MNKYDWSNVPIHIMWIATDRHAGCAFGYYSEPKICNVMGIWKSNNVSDYLSLGIEPFKGNWKDSLEERPND